MYTNNGGPEAYVSTGRNRLKIYSGKNVYLKDGQEFEIELFNPTNQTIAAKISINGKPISNQMLVIKPGERSYLERFLDTNSKLKFSTYDVENSAAAKKAIEDNGGIKIDFYKEKIVQQHPTYVPFNNPWPTTTWYPYGTTSNGSFATPTNTFTVGSGLSGTGSGISGTTTTTSAANGTYTCDSSSALCSDSITTGSSSTYFCSTDLSGASGIIGARGVAGPSGPVGTKSIETGRVESGSHSSQSFDTYYGDFEYFAFATLEYKIMPESNQPVNLKSLRAYCPGCRTRVRKASWKFCPSCGETLD